MYLRERQRAWAARQRERFLRPDFERYLKPDWRDRKYWRTPPPDWAEHPGDACLPPPNRADEARRRDAILHEYVQIKRLIDDLRRELRACSVKYDPDQPRVPAGNPDGGQWTSGQEVDSGSPTDISAVGLSDRALQAYCLAQYARDSIICRRAKSRSCWAQAAERLAACLSRKPIPPLNY